MEIVNEFIKDYYPTLSLLVAVVTIWWIYKNRSKSINHPIVIGMSAISLIIAVTTAIYLCCNGGCLGISSINYGDTSVVVLTTIVGLLIGWNIYTVIDTKSEVAKLKEERAKLQEYVKANRNYAIGITNFTNQKYGIAIGFLCSAAVKLNKINETEAVKDCLDIINNAIKVCKSRMGDISYLETMYKKTKFDFNRIDDERIKTISAAIEDIITPKTEEPQNEQSK